MKTKTQSLWRPPFQYFELGIGGTVVLYDAELDLPLITGNKALVGAFIRKYIPATSDVYYYTRNGFKSWNNIGFSIKTYYRGLEAGLEGESEEVVKTQSSPKIVK